MPRGTRVERAGGERMVPVVGKLLDQAASVIWEMPAGQEPWPCEMQSVCGLMRDAKRSTTCVTFSPSRLSEKRFQPTSLCKVCERRL